MGERLGDSATNEKTALAPTAFPSTIPGCRFPIPDFQTTMRLGLYGGTFDPIHHGHLILAREAIETLELDRVVFIPASLSPHKLSTSPASGAIRRDMVAAAIAGEPRFELDASEIDRAGPSFTIDTVEHLRARYPDAELFYFIGEDNVAALHTWRRVDDLRRLVQFVVFGRNGDSGSNAFPRIPRRIDISATEVRSRVARGQSIRYLVPESVRALIEQHHLYQDPLHQS
jgi:nicotinate-nucleotide adenylyltransferase